jgi:hypothetical protein
MVSVLAIGPKVRGFRPGRGDRFLRAINVHSIPSFRGEVKAEAPCKILRYVKITCKYEHKYFRAKFLFLFPISPANYHMSVLV